jgi:DNA-binding NtrC family response regulator
VSNLFAPSKNPQVSGGFCRKENYRGIDMNEISRVLLIGDDATLREQLIRVIYLIDPNTRVVTAENPQEGGELLAQSEPEDAFKLVILDLDVKSPLAGVDLWNSCRKKYYDTEFLVISGLPMKEFLKVVDTVGGIPAHLPKPFQLDQCKAFVASFLTGNFELAA